MPIKPENKKRYPMNWKVIRAAILERAGNRCEQCGIPNHVWRNRVTGRWTNDAGQTEIWMMDGDRTTYVVLTIAHLDHTPEHCSPDNLRALCQRCHLAYDAGHHQQTAYATRRKNRVLRDLFAHA